MRFGLVLAFILAAYWWALSGYFIPMILAFGVISILLVLGLCFRMRIMDSETVPYLYIPKTLSYFVWLFGEIVKANVEVVKAVLSPDLEISPTMVSVPSSRQSDIGRTMFANSITLTPGTVSVEMTEDEILVHALLSDMSKPESFAEMGTRAGWSVGETLTPKPEGGEA